MSVREPSAPGSLRLAGSVTPAPAGLDTFPAALRDTPKTAAETDSRCPCGYAELPGRRTPLRCAGPVREEDKLRCTPNHHGAGRRGRAADVPPTMLPGARTYLLRQASVRCRSGVQGTIVSQPKFRGGAPHPLLGHNK